MYKSRNSLYCSHDIQIILLHKSLNKWYLVEESVYLFSVECWVYCVNLMVSRECHKIHGLIRFSELLVRANFEKILF